MAEEEVAKHVKKIYRTLKNTEHSWAHKLKEIIVEVLIIVFAVSLSIWFHNWSDSLHDHNEEKVFLTGLKTDINGDLANLNAALNFYNFALKGSEYFLKVGSGAQINKDSISKYASVFFSSTALEPHNSRYEALKGSNKFDIIENQELLNDMISLHESSFARIEELDKYYHDDINNQVLPCISSNAQLSPEGEFTNAEQLIRRSQTRVLLMTMHSFIAGNLLDAHNKAIKKCQVLLNEIDRELK